ncbi:ComF family protein [Parasediminibacterium paludis]|uniref:ComF family protein n=1 Tax=Parasediminibacterium paludis TaxID=908966 RepID=A0ABV8PT45_9BACT
MISLLKSYINSFSHLIYPHNCEGCGTDVLNDDSYLCAKCLHDLPITGFVATANNPVEQSFYGKLQVEAAASGFYFHKDGLVQHLVTQLKYKNHQEMGVFLGKLIGHQLSATDRFDSVDVLVPLPLNHRKEDKRGYNQATLICEGISQTWPKLICTDVVKRTIFTESQTSKTRIDRWQNMEGVFELSNANSIAGKHVLLVDDVTTTGATLEACGCEILKAPNTTLSIVTVAFAI